MGKTAALTLALAVLFAGCDTKSHGQQNEKTLANVVAALKTYYADHSAYPKQLSELRPKYIAQVPTLKGRGVKWAYDPSLDQKSFTLAFVSDGDEWTGGYSSVKDRYYTDTK